jgi:hypothetical protein
MGNEEMAGLMMKSAGYEDVKFTRVDEKILVGTTLEECIAFALAIGPGGEVFREAGEEHAELKRAEIERDMSDYFASQEADRDGIWAPTSSWVISGRNPA